MYLIDGNPLLYRALHAYTLTTSRGEPSGVVYGAVKILLGLVRTLDIDTSQVVVFWDWGRSRYRVARYPAYKDTPTRAASRSMLPGGSFKDQRQAVFDILQAKGIRQVGVEGVEADDLIAIATTTGQHVVVADDHDLWQLVGRNATQVYAPVKDLWIRDRDDCYRVTGLWPEQIAAYKALAGDPSDGIPGATGIGDKTAKAILAAVEGLPDLYRRLRAGDPLPITPRAISTLLAEEERIKLWFDLCLPLGFADLNASEQAGFLTAWQSPLQPNRIAEYEMYERWDLDEFRRKLAAVPWVKPNAPEVEPDDGIVRRGLLDNAEDWSARLAGIAAQVQGCNACAMRKECSAPVPGNVEQDGTVPWVMIVGRNPGASEDREGRGFVGPAGRRLNQLLAGRAQDDREVHGRLVDRSTAWVTNTAKCVDGQTQVRLPSGETMRIDRMFKMRYTGDVLTVDSAGNLTTRRVVGWYRSRRNGRRLYRLRHVYAKNTGTGPAGVTLTEDHQVLTRRGWVEASSLRCDDEIATGEPQPGPRAMQIVIGTMLGDATITQHQTGQSPALSFAHATAQTEWLQTKAAALVGFRGTTTSGYANVAGKIHTSIKFRTAAGAFWRHLRRRFYNARRKIIPKDLVEQIDDLGLAVWFLDDGNTAHARGGTRPWSSIATNSFSKKEVMWLCNLLNRRGFECRVVFSSGWRLRFSADGTVAFLTRIARYVPPSMRYKLTPDLRGVPFVATAYAPEPTTVFYAPIEIKEVRPRHNASGGDLPVYCLDVEDTHAFVTPGGVVHNCYTAANRAPEFAEWQTCATRWLREEVRIIQPRLILSFGTEAMHALTGHADSIMQRSGLTVSGAEANGVVQYASLDGGERCWDPIIPPATTIIVLPHPAAALRTIAAELKLQQAGRVVEQWLKENG